jgi:hypothetical protein
MTSIFLMAFFNSTSRYNKASQDFLAFHFTLTQNETKKSRLQFLSSKTFIKGKLGGRVTNELFIFLFDFVSSSFLSSVPHVALLQTLVYFLFEFVGSSLCSSAPNSLNFLFCF